MAKKRLCYCLRRDRKAAEGVDDVTSNRPNSQNFPIPASLRLAGADTPARENNEFTEVCIFVRLSTS